MSAFWSGRRVLLTGHTGFKGAWLSLWLERLGAETWSLALPAATQPSLHALVARAPDQRAATLDIRDGAALAAFAREARPSVVLHLAAQALVRVSYADPAGTFATNVGGTVNLLTALRGAPELEAVVVATTDKVYANDEAGRPFVETDALGGHDPYSASKACCEIAVASLRDSLFVGGPRIATARAGNVIGGGDWSADRIVPDMVRAAARGDALELRSPDAVRPWQHVLEPLAGYLAFAEALATGRTAETALNFGPDPEAFARVRELVDAMRDGLGLAQGWRPQPGEHPREAGLLTLDSTRARDTLGWRPLLDFRSAAEWTARWYADWRAGADARALCLAQIAAYEALSREALSRQALSRDRTARP